MSSRTPTFTALTNGGPLAGLQSSVTMMDAKIRADDPSASCRDRLQTAGYGLCGAENIDKCRCKILKMAAPMAILQVQLVDRTVLEDMGPPTVGFNARSELPTDPTALSGASVGRTSVATRIS